MTQPQHRLPELGQELLLAAHAPFPWGTGQSEGSRHKPISSGDPSRPRDGGIYLFTAWKSFGQLIVARPRWPLPAAQGWLAGLNLVFI